MSETVETKPPVVALQDTLAAMQKGMDHLAMLVSDCRDTITEATGVMHSQGADILQQLEGVQGQLAATPRRWPSWRWLGSSAGLGLVLGMGLMGAVWWTRPPSPYARFVGALDHVLVQQYAVLPKGVQEQLTAVYTQAQVQSPGQRQGKGK